MELKAAETLARTLMNKHGLQAWTFAFDNTVRRFGCCHHFTHTITLSRHLVELNIESEVRNVILHEIAHALAPHGAMHGKKWKHIARSIGCTGDRCYGDDVVTPPPKYIGHCRVCKREHKSHRRTNSACGSCPPLTVGHYIVCPLAPHIRMYEPPEYDPRCRIIWTKVDDTMIQQG